MSPEGAVLMFLWNCLLIIWGKRGWFDLVPKNRPVRTAEWIHEQVEAQMKADAEGESWW